MDVGSISQNAISGITKGINQANTASERLASPEQLSGEKSTKETTNDLLDLKQAETQVKISARVAQTAGDIIGSIIDVHA
jgi:hypothetical protein